jgi:hypothetical protein
MSVNTKEKRNFSLQRHLISYPKSGRTWIRFILSELELAGAIQFHHDRFEFNDGARPAHDFDVESRLALYRPVEKLVYLERDPRDVMVSLYHQVTGRFIDFFNYSGSLSDFIRDDYFGAHNLQRFRAMWHEIAQRRDVHRVSYEDCHRDTEGTLLRLLAYYELPVDPMRLKAAVEAGQFDNMKALEASGTFDRPWLRPRNGAPKVRRGVVGGFADVLSADDIAYLSDVFWPGTPAS